MTCVLSFPALLTLTHTTLLPTQPTQTCPPPTPMNPPQAAHHSEDPQYPHELLRSVVLSALAMSVAPESSDSKDAAEELLMDDDDDGFLQALGDMDEYEQDDVSVEGVRGASVEVWWELCGEDTQGFGTFGEGCIDGSDRPMKSVRHLVMRMTHALWSTSCVCAGRRRRGRDAPGGRG